jgi:MYXO-CTERM domain-containing protein
MSIYFDGALTPLIDLAVNLDLLLSFDSGKAFVGFTAGTGEGFQNQDILNWQFVSVPEPASATLGILGAIGLLAIVSHARRRSVTDRISVVLARADLHRLWDVWFAWRSRNGKTSSVGGNVPSL